MHGPAAPARHGLFARLSIRNKLLVMVLLPLAGVLPLLGAILLWWSGEAFDQLLITKVRADLAVAQGYFDRTLAETGASARAIAESHALHAALAAGASDADVAALLERWRAGERLDFVNLRTPEGQLRATQDGPAAGTDRSSAAFLAVTGGAEQTSVEVLSRAQLERLGPTLGARVPVALVPTRNKKNQVEWKRVELTFDHRSADRGGNMYDTHTVTIKGTHIRTQDLQNLGVAYGLKTNTGEVWLQYADDNYKLGGR